MAEQILKNAPIYNVFMFIFSLGQFVGILPLDYVKNAGNSTMRFRWTSYKTIYSSIHIMILICIFGFCVSYGHLSPTGWTFFHIVRTIFYFCSVWSAFSFFVITRKWPDVFKKWIEVDNQLESNYKFPKSIPKRSKVTAIVLTAYTTYQALLFLANNIYSIKAHAARNNLDFGHQMYFTLVFPHIFMFIPYSIFAGLIVQLIYVFCIWRMAYTDLFICFVSSCLSIRFRQITNRLEQSLNMNRTITFWRNIREDYDRVCTLCKELDEVITNVIFVSYASNLMLLLVYLRHCTLVEGLNWEKIYNLLCFMVYLIRIFLISLYVSWVNDESKEPSFVLNSVSTTQYNSEIQRFLQQISFNSVAFSGNKMFRVTRTLILNIGGIILTYELVLVQFSEFNFN